MDDKATKMTPAAEMSADDLMGFFSDVLSVYSSAVTGSQAQHIEGVTVEGVIAACSRIKGRLKRVESARAAVTALIAERDALRGALYKIVDVAESYMTFDEGSRFGIAIAEANKLLLRAEASHA